MWIQHHSPISAHIYWNAYIFQAQGLALYIFSLIKSSQQTYEIGGVIMPIFTWGYYGLEQLTNFLKETLKQVVESGLKNTKAWTSVPSAITGHPSPLSHSTVLKYFPKLLSVDIPPLHCILLIPRAYFLSDAGVLHCEEHTFHQWGGGALRGQVPPWHWSLGRTSLKAHMACPFWFCFWVWVLYCGFVLF